MRDRNLLFGVLAVRFRFVTPEQLMAAASVWTSDPDRPLGDILVKNGAISSGQKDDLDSLVGEMIGKNGGDPRAALASAGGPQAVQESFAGSVNTEAMEKSLPSFGGPPPMKKESGETGSDNDVEPERLVSEHPGRYIIKGEFGRGGIGRVFVAQDSHLGREIAIKELITLDPVGTPATPVSPRDGHGRDSYIVARFLREARVTGQLEHPGIVPVYELGRRANGSLYYTMRLVQGKTLSEAIAGKSLLERLLLLPRYLKLCQTVAYAHSKEVIHRDLKPQNVILGEFGETVLLDWGLAKVRGKKDIRADSLERGAKALKGGTEGTTVKGKPIGTPSYMSPEQADGRVEDIDERSDIWSMGAILYEILTGAPPFVGETSLEVMGKVLNEEPTPVRKREPNAPRELAVIVERCLRKNPKQRYQSVPDLARDIEAFQTGGLVSVMRYSKGDLIFHWLKTRWPIVATVVAAFLALLGVGVWSYMSLAAERARAEKNLSEVFVEKGLNAEKENRWSEARLYYAGALAMMPSSGGRSGLYRDIVSPLRGILRWSSARGTGGMWVAFSPSGQMVASGGTSGKISLWNVGTGKEIRTLTGHEDRVTSIAFSPDGRLLASGSRDKTIILWDVAGGKEVQAITGHQGWVNAVAFSPDGRLLASGSRDKTVALWGVASGKMVRSFPGHRTAVLSVAFSPDGRYLASGGEDKSVRLWDIVSGSPVRVFPEVQGPVNAVAFSPDGRYLASGGDDREIIVWDITTGSPYKTLMGHSEPAVSLAYSPDGKLLISGSGDSTIRVWDALTGKEVLVLPGDRNSVQSAAFSPDGNIFASGYNDGSIQVWELAKGMEVRALSVGRDWISSLAFSPDGKLLASGSYDSTVRLLDAATGKEVAVMRGHTRPVFTAAYSPDGRYLASGGDDRTIRVWEVPSGRTSAVLTGHQSWVTSVAFSPDGRYLASGSDDKTIKLWEAATGKELATLAGHSRAVYSVAFSPDGKFLASGSADKTVRIWEMPGSKEAAVLEDHARPVFSVAFSSDGKLLASGGEDNAIRLWDTETWNEVMTLSGTGGSMSSVVFFSKGKFLVSGGDDKTIRLWDAASGEELMALSGRQGRILTVAVSPDGRVIASGSDDGTISFWPVVPELVFTSPQRLLSLAQADSGLRIEGIRIVSAPAPR